MKQTEILPTLEKLFANPPFAISNTYAVCWLNGRLDIIPVTCPRQPEVVFGIYSKEDIRLGLTSRGWNRLENKIILFLTQKGLI